MTIDGGEEALAYPAQGRSSFSEHQTSYLDPADVFKEFEVHRSSAEYYLDQYLDYLARSCLEPDIPTASQGTIILCTQP